jgi:hypothetical protein
MGRTSNISNYNTSTTNTVTPNQTTYSTPINQTKYANPNWGPTLNKKLGINNTVKGPMDEELENPFLPSAYADDSQIKIDEGLKIGGTIESQLGLGNQENTLRGTSVLTQKLVDEQYGGDYTKLPSYTAEGKRIYTTPGGNKTTKNLDLNPKLGIMIDTMEQQKLGNYGFNAKTGVPDGKVAGPPKTGSWNELVSPTYGGPMYINKNEKLDQQGLQSALNNQYSDRQFNQFLKNQWTPNWSRQKQTSKLSLDTMTFNVNGMQKSFNDMLSGWNVSDSKRNEYVREMEERVKNLNKAWGLDKPQRQNISPNVSSGGKAYLELYDPSKFLNPNPNANNSKKLESTKKAWDKLVNPNNSY